MDKRPVVPGILEGKNQQTTMKQTATILTTMLLAPGGLISGATAAAAQTANFVWNSPVTGNWGDAAKWTNGQSTGVAPAAAGRADYALEQEKGSNRKRGQVYLTASNFRLWLESSRTTSQYK
jgi:hypothetical protein